jgi:endo-1,4-beta-xylanase
VPPDINRRSVLAAMAALPVETPANGPPQTLCAAARLSGRDYGCAARLDRLEADGDFKAALAHECGALTPELELKWAAVEPRRGELDFRRMDALTEFARQTGKSVHGHTLVWHRSIPDWAQAALQGPDDWTLVQRYFASVMPRYGEAIARWDVVNEPIDPAQADGLRDSPYKRAFGPDYVRRALETARLFAPRAKLMINEYGLEYDEAEDRPRRAAFLRLVDQLRGQGAPLDGVGLQSHLNLGKGRLSQKSLSAFLRELAQRDLFIRITELDVKEADYAMSVERRDAAVAALTRAYLEAALDEPNVIGVTTWGLSDRYSWLEVTPSDLQRRPDAWRDGSSPGLNRGLPLDSSLERKPMYQAMLAAFRTAGGKTGGGSII